MARMLFPNLAVSDVAATKSFFAGLGFTFNEVFSDEDTVCMEISPTTYVMMMHRPKFQDFIEDAITDTSKEREVLLALSAVSREEVDELVDKAVALGGHEWREGKGEDNEVMYGRAFRDLDDHVWEVMWMDVEAATGGAQQAPEL
ncbi:VOC family protein [Mumia sp. DW29H23]|uniref:VOC family protein n=1 Tax=Mumia sp. DW29H23 TaxID=3421241 RepID=UPI003D68ECD7